MPARRHVMREEKDSEVEEEEKEEEEEEGGEGVMERLTFNEIF